MNNNLKAAFAASVFLVVFGITGLLLIPTEKYSPVVEHVQDKAVMITLPSTMEQVYMIFTSSGISVNTSTVPVNYIGSGVFVTNKGHILSCAHVIDHEATGPIVATLSNGTTMSTFVVYKDTTSDLALLKVDIKGNNYATLTEKALRLGQEVIAVGNPHGQHFTTTHGIISYVGRWVDEAYAFTQIDAPINGGNSGGPLFNLQGELIGINARKWPDADGMGLAISPQTIKSFLDIFKGA